MSYDDLVDDWSAARLLEIREVVGKLVGLKVAMPSLVECAQGRVGVLERVVWHWGMKEP